MSGIAGLVRVNSAPVSPQAIESMVATMVRRGPDRRRVWWSGNRAFGHTLLATTPESAVELQPWVHAESGCVVVSDSRLDNRPELLRALELSGAPDEIGDAELLHEAYQRWGEGCAARLLGDFAFAIYDHRARRLFCARDIMGIRPFYYHHAPGRLFAFASSVDALLSQADIPADLNEGRIADAIVSYLEGIDKVCTFYQGIVRLPPAHVLILEGGHLWMHEYWHPLMRRPQGLPASEAGWIDALREQVRLAVHRRLRASSTVGSMLSGGIDSSSVVAMAHVIRREEGGEPLATFSAINSDGVCGETRAVHSVLRSVKATPTNIDLQSFDGVAPTLRRHVDEHAEPFDSSNMLVDGMYWAASAAGVKVLMDGMPADNLYPLAGYVQQLARHGQLFQAYAEAAHLHRWNQRSCVRLRAVATVAGTWAPASYHRMRTRQVQRTFYEREILDATLIDRDFARRATLWDRYIACQEDMARAMVRDPADRALSGMTAAFITAAVERYGRVAACHGVEPRHPFLDRELVEFHAWLPLELRDRAGWNKWALRRAMEGLMPPDVAWRPKDLHLGHDFNVAVAEGSCDDLVRHGPGDLQAYVDPRKVEAAGRRWRKERYWRAFGALHSAALVGSWLRRQSVRAERPIHREQASA